ncbi:hypothetical protein RB195_003521 [Necator americanus]|uniref:Uncharacterized protein n=1 Tax=Necator americanus TaxID=51031 RepID=A0ABR1DNX8_NECAM
MSSTTTAATLAFFLSIFLLLVYVFEMDFTAISSNVLSAAEKQRCNCELVTPENLICPTTVIYDKNEPEEELDENKTTFRIPRQEWYNELLAAGVGKKAPDSIGIIQSYYERKHAALVYTL